jgi:hypothetical protein
VVALDKEVQEPAWKKRHYIPSTWPGARAPHVYLQDGKTSIFDLFGNDYTLIDFSSDGIFAKMFADAAKKFAIPLKTVHLPKERHARRVWERVSVLVRPDDHVAWRASINEKRE